MKTFTGTIYQGLIGFKPGSIKFKFKYIRDLGNSRMEIVLDDEECILDKISVNTSYKGMVIYNDDNTKLYIFNDVTFDTDIFVGIQHCNKLTFKYNFYETKELN